MGSRRFYESHTTRGGGGDLEVPGQVFQKKHTFPIPKTTKHPATNQVYAGKLKYLNRGLHTIGISIRTQGTSQQNQDTSWVPHAQEALDLYPAGEFLM